MSSSSSRYELLIRIASGGMGTVHLARLRGAAGFSRLVAVKRPHPHLIEDPTLRESVLVEARIASLFRHPNIVGVLDVEQIGDEIMLVMDYVEGGTLSELLARNDEAPELTSGLTLRIVLDACAGLQAAHSAKDEHGRPLRVVHRDVSPQNILVAVDGVARVSDFGIAKALASHGRRTNDTATGMVKGKLGYIAPEILDGRGADPRSDQFALAVVAWEALAHERLFGGRTEAETVSRVLKNDVPPLSRKRPELAPFDPVLKRALDSDAESRFESISAFAYELERIAREIGLLASHEDVGRHVERVFGKKLVERRREMVETVEARVVLDDKGESVAGGAPATRQMEAPSLPRRRRSRLALGLFLLLIGAAVGLGALALRGQLGPREPLAAPPSSPSPPSPPTASEPPVIVMTGSAAIGGVANGAISSASTGRVPVMRNPHAAPRGSSSGRYGPEHAPPNPYGDHR